MTLSFSQTKENILTNEDKNSMLLANRISWKGKIIYDENAMEKIDIKVSFLE